MINDITSYVSAKAIVFAANECGLNNADCATGVTAFFSTGAGKMLKGFLGVIGLLVVLVALFKVVGRVGQGKIGEAFKIGLGAAALASVLIQPTLVQSLLAAFGSIADTVITSFSDVADKSKGTTK
jgi:hypothetical protein